MDNIKVMLGRNGYSAYFLDSCVRRFFNCKYDKMLNHHEENKIKIVEQLLLGCPFR